jgi:hypothetical protein
MSEFPKIRELQSVKSETLLLQQCLLNGPSELLFVASLKCKGRVEREYTKVYAGSVENGWLVVHADRLPYGLAWLPIPSEFGKAL